MGLKEKRAAKEFQDNRLEALKKQIFDKAKYEMEIDIDWDTLAVENYSHLYDEAWPKVYFTPLIDALKEMCDDDLSREAIQKNLKKIIICNHSDNYSADRWARYKDGILTLNHSPITNIHHIEDRKLALRHAVEKEL